MRVKLDVHKPLTRIVGLHPEGNKRMSFQVKYEKLPKFCDVCGLFGHGDLECWDGVHDKESKQYGSWMVAPVEDWHPQTSGVRRAPAREGSGGGGSSAKILPRKRPQGDSPPGTGKGGGADSAPLLQITQGSGKDLNGAKPAAQKNLDLILSAEANNNNGAGVSPVKPDPKRPRRSSQETEGVGSEERRQDQ